MLRNVLMCLPHANMLTWNGVVAILRRGQVIKPLAVLQVLLMSLPPIAWTSCILAQE